MQAQRVSALQGAEVTPTTTSHVATGSVSRYTIFRFAEGQRRDTADRKRSTCTQRRVLSNYSMAAEKLDIFLFYSNLCDSLTELLIASSIEKLQL